MKITIKDLAELIRSVAILLGVLLIIYLIYTGWQLRSVEFGTEGVNAQLEPPSTPIPDDLTFDANTTLAAPPTDISEYEFTFPAMPTETPLPVAAFTDFGEWIVTTGRFTPPYSIDAVQAHAKSFKEKGYEFKIFCRISEADPNQIHELRTAIVGFSSQEAANQVLPNVQALGIGGQVKQFSTWCLNPNQQPDYISCNYVSCP